MSRNKLYLAILLPFLATKIYAEPAVSSSPSDHVLLFQVVQDQFTIDNSTVKNAAIVEDEGVYKGLNIELKPEAVKEFTEMTTAGLGRKLNLIFNKVVVTTTTIQSSLGGNFLISGISKQDAEAFLNVLNANKPKVEEE